VYCFVLFVIWLIGPAALYGVVASFFLYRWTLKQREESERHHNELLKRAWQQQQQQQQQRPGGPPAPQAAAGSTPAQKSSRITRRGNIHTLNYEDS
jgi:hypothetical protein